MRRSVANSRANVKQSDLDNQHMEYLQALSYRNPLRLHMPSHIEEALLNSGCIQSAIGGHVITNMGHQAMINHDGNS